VSQLQNGLSRSRKMVEIVIVAHNETDECS